MATTSELLRNIQIIIEWDWDDVEVLKSAIEFIRDSTNGQYTKYLPSMLDNIRFLTDARIILPVHKRPIIAVDVRGRALTGELHDLQVERLPYDPAGHR